MRKKGTVAAQKDEALTKRYGQIGISAVAAAARYQRPDMSEKFSPRDLKARARIEVHFGELLRNVEFMAPCSKKEPVIGKATRNHQFPCVRRSTCGPGRELR